MDRALQSQQDTIRLPLYTEEGFRSDWSAFDQTFINCFAEIARDTSTGEGYTVITKRPGFQKTSLNFSTTFPDDSVLKPLVNMTITSLYDVCIGAFYYGTTASIYIIAYKPIAGTYEIVGEISGRTSNDRVFIEECQLGAVAAQVPGFTVSLQNANMSASFGYYAQSVGGAFTAGSLQTITAPNFPVNLGKVTTGPLIQMNGLFYIATVDGLIYQTFAGYPYDLTATAWNSSSNYFSTGRYPDQLMGVFRYKHHLIAMGKDSIEFLNDDVDLTNATSGTSISSTSQAFIKFGAISPKLVLNVDDVLYWVSYGSSNTLGLWKLDGYTPVKISTKRQDLVLNKSLTGFLTDPLTMLFSIVMGNKKHIGINNVFMYTIQYAGSSVNEDETFPVSASQCRSNILMYNLDDRTWWGMSLANLSDCAILPAVSFGNTITINPYIQYVLVHTRSGAGYGTDSLFTVAESLSPGQYYDSIPHQSIAGSFDYTPILICIQPNALWFNNERRKRISRVSLIFVNSLTKDSADTYTYKIFLVYNKENVIDSQSGASGFANNVVRSIDIPNFSYRYYINNLGMVRVFAPCIYCRSKDTFTLRAIELNLAQGTA